MMRSVLTRRMQHKIWRFLQCEDGPTSVEYAIMVAIVVIVTQLSQDIYSPNANVIAGR